MVQFIFLHGVANRRTPDRAEGEKQRDDYLREFVFGRGVTIQNPFWGDFGANPPGGRYRSLPDYEDPTAGGVEHLNVGDGSGGLEGEAPSLIELAREDFPETVDLIFQSVIENGEQDETFLETARIVGTYALADPKPAWLEDDLTDEQFLSQLQSISQQYAAQQSGVAAPDEIETLGLGGWLRDGARKLKDRVRNSGGRLVLATGREAAHTAIARFIGDVFVYLKEGAGRGPIRQVLQDALQPAIASGESIVVLGHSMGGVILVDCLGDPEFCGALGLKNGKKIDVLLTVGSQPGFFHELDLLTTKGKEKLDSVAAWLNIYDELDVLSFRAAPFFATQATDMLFSSRTGLLDSHTAYFTRVQFYLRLKARLKELGIKTE